MQMENYQWNGVAQYPSYGNTSGYMPSSHHQHQHHHPSSHNGVYSEEQSYQLSSNYYPTTHCTSSPVYSPVSPSDSDSSSFAHYPPQTRSDHTRPPHQTYPHSQSYGYAPTSHARHDDSYTRPRSHSQAYPAHETISLSPPTSGYQQIPLSPASPNAQFPGSARPFQCEVCGLSFNRQHDLKRHRDTHTGDKPFPCNGGCGKTFTRKDALKRHQMVKGCGQIEEGRS